MSINLERLKQINYLENTVLLHRGTAEMFSQWRVSKYYRSEENDNPQRLYRDFCDFTSELEKDASMNKDTQNRTDRWRNQNKLTEFFRFLQDETLASRGTIEPDSVCTWAAKLLCLFDTTESIEGESDDSAIPYLFERLCNGMRDIAGSQMSYLVYCRGSNMTPLASSSIALDMLNYMLDKEDFQHMGWKWKDEETKEKRTQERKQGVRQESAVPQERPIYQETQSKYMIADTILRSDQWKLSATGEDYRHFHTLSLRLKKSSLERDAFYVIFQYKDEMSQAPAPLWENRENRPLDLSNSDLERMRNILFLYDSLIRLLKKKLHILITSQKTFQNVRPISTKASRAETGAPLFILHLTDLHIRSRNRKDLEDLFQNFPKRVYQNDQDKTGYPIDLVAITGDVVQGQCTAGELEDHYRLADQLLRTLAQRLWRYEGKDEIRSDWYKRIVIVPGNHDYASMNELEVVSQKGSRSTGIGRPSQKEGGPMVKFAYYIEFIHRLLGLDMGEQIRSWLNSVRRYDKLGLALLCVNTVAGSGPLRNNKVYINKDFVHTLNAGDFDGLDTICLAHHTVEYKVNYAIDRYYSSKIEKNVTKDPIQEMEQCVDEFAEILKMPRKNAIDLSAIEQKLDTLRTKLTGYKMISEEDPIMADVMYYQRNFRNADDERCEAIRSAMIRDINMKLADLQAQTESFDGLISIAKIKIILGGHIHKVNLSRNRHCYEGPLFYDTSNNINYGILKLNRDDHDWTLYTGSTLSQKPDYSSSISKVPTDIITL